MTNRPSQVPAPGVLHIIVPEPAGSIGGADLHVIDLAVAQRESGDWSPIVLAPRASDEFLARLDDAALPSLDSFAVSTGVGRLAGITGRLGALPSQMGIRVLHSHGYEATYLMVAMRALSRRRWRPIAAVATCHGWIETTLSLRAKSWLDRRCSRTADAAIACSTRTAQRLVATRGHAVVSTIHNGVPIPGPLAVATRSEAAREVRHRLGAGRDTVVVGSVGRLSSEKRVDLFLQAAGLLAATPSDVVFVVVGGGPDRPALERHVHRLGLDRRARFLGLVRDMEPVYGALDVLVQPSDLEGTPRTVLEAMARGIPVVATAVGDVPVLVRDGSEGLLVRRGDHVALAAALRSLADNRDLRRRLGNNSRERATSHFSIERMQQQTAAVYSATLDLQRGRPDEQETQRGEAAST
jgi:glycosyltransferase involved in cell wall biosynthesis